MEEMVQMENTLSKKGSEVDKEKDKFNQQLIMLEQKNQTLYESLEASQKDCDRRDQEKEALQEVIKHKDEEMDEIRQQLLKLKSEVIEKDDQIR